MSDKPAAGADEATVVMSKDAVQEAEPAAATVINPAGSAVNIPMHSTGSAFLSASQRSIAGAVPAPEKPRSIALALATGALTGLVLFALTVLWLSRGH